MSQPTALLKAHIRTATQIRYTGRQHGVNELLHIRPLYQAFVLANLDFFKTNYGYKLRPGHDKPGQKARIFSAFRDAWLPNALREIRAEDAGVHVDSIPETEYTYKKNQALSNTGERCIQGVRGWEDAVAENVKQVCESRAQTEQTERAQTEQTGETSGEIGETHGPKSKKRSLGASKAQKARNARNNAKVAKSAPADAGGDRVANDEEPRDAAMSLMEFSDEEARDAAMSLMEFSHEATGTTDMT